MSQGVVKSVGRVLEVLDLFRARKQPLSATNICSHLGYPNSSGNALLKSMVSLGYLWFDTQTRRYFPSLKVTQLGEWIPAHVLTQDTVSLLEDLRQRTGETVTLSVQNDLHMQFIRVLPGTFPISLMLTEGFLGPLFGSAIGTAFLSLLPDAQVERLYLKARRTPDSISTKVDPDELMREVREARQRGYSVGYERIMPDTGAVAMPVPTESGERSLVVGVGGLSPRIRRSEANVIQAMKAALQQFGGRLSSQ